MNLFLTSQPYHSFRDGQSDFSLFFIIVETIVQVGVFDEHRLILFQLYRTGEDLHHDGWTNQLEVLL